MLWIQIRLIYVNPLHEKDPLIIDLDSKKSWEILKAKIAGQYTPFLLWCYEVCNVFWQGWGADGSWVFLAPRSRSHLKKKQEPEPEPLGKKSQEPEPVGAGCFLPLGAGAGAARKKIPGAGAAWEKNKEPEPLKNFPAPQPWFLVRFKVGPGVSRIRVFYFIIWIRNVFSNKTLIH